MSRRLEWWLEVWKSGYRDDRLPIDGPGDKDWLDEGALLLKEVKAALRDEVEIVVTEPWWDFPDQDFDQPGGGDRSSR